MRIKPSMRTHGYYRAVIVPRMRDACGYVTDAEAHRAIKSGFFEMHPDSPDLPSMGDMSREEASRLIDFAIIQLAQMNVVVPDPRTGKPIKLAPDPVDEFDGMGVSLSDLEGRF